LARCVHAVPGICQKYKPEIFIFAIFPVYGGANCRRQNPFSPKPVLQQLKKVVLWTDDMKDYYHARDLLPFFYLPAMRVFSAGGVCEDEPILSAPKAGDIWDQGN
jgi:hypothetical protein